MPLASQDATMHWKHLTKKLPCFVNYAVDLNYSFYEKNIVNVFLGAYTLCRL